MVKLSIVILCWNDFKVISNCLSSIFSGVHSTEFEVIVSDNGSTDGSPERIREAFPLVHVIENGENLRFSKGNNVGIRASRGEYILILNPDTIIHDGSLDRWIEFADRHPEAGGFGCRVLNPDGSYQRSGRPFPTIWRGWLGALCLGALGHISDVFIANEYIKWKGDTERTIDWQSGCCLMVRADLLKRLGGLDDQLQYYYEDVDLCHRIWDAGHSIVFTPEVTITHLGGQSTTQRFPVAFELDKYRNCYRYFYKYFGREGVQGCRRYSLVRIWIRQVVYRCVWIMKPSDRLKARIEMYRVAAQWNRRIDPVLLVEKGKEPALGPQMPLSVSR
jgi:N-acetylglucosaminyl-diphospho-decaprenol L-rhamnosyltransferase